MRILSLRPLGIARLLAVMLLSYNALPWIWMGYYDVDFVDFGLCIAIGIVLCSAHVVVVVVVVVVVAVVVIVVVVAVVVVVVVAVAVFCG